MGMDNLAEPAAAPLPTARSGFSVPGLRSRSASARTTRCRTRSRPRRATPARTTTRPARSARPTLPGRWWRELLRLAPGLREDQVAQDLHRLLLRLGLRLEEAARGAT